MAQIIDTWGQIGERIADGSYIQRYNIGDTKSLAIKIDGIPTDIVMRIVAFNEDTLFDTCQKAPITWISDEVIPYYQANPIATNQGGWKLSDIRKRCIALHHYILDEDAKELIKPARKTSYHYDTKCSHTTKDYCWIPSAYEIFGKTSSVFVGDEDGPCYSVLFNNNKARIKQNITTKSTSWWLRSSGDINGSYWKGIHDDGTCYHFSADDRHGILLGFCTAV